MIKRANLDKKFLRPEDEDMTLGLTDQETYRLSSMQAKNILQMRLQSLSGLEQEKIHAEYKELVDTIIDLTDILAKPNASPRSLPTALKPLQPNSATKERLRLLPMQKTSRQKT